MNKKSSGRRSRRVHTPAFKAKEALAALREDKTMAELCIGRSSDHENAKDDVNQY